MGHVGEEVRRLRRERGWSQPRLSVEAEIAVSALSGIENGRRSPNAATLTKLAKAFGVEVRDLFPKGGQPRLPFGEGRGPAVSPELADRAEDLAEAGDEEGLHGLYRELWAERERLEEAHRADPDDLAKRAEFARAVERAMFVALRLASLQRERAEARLAAGVGQA